VRIEGGTIRVRTARLSAPATGHQPNQRRAACVKSAHEGAARHDSLRDSCQHFAPHRIGLDAVTGRLVLAAKNCVFEALQSQVKRAGR
jgi:hypothetical protein